MLKPNPLMDCVDINGLLHLIQSYTCFKRTPTLIDLCITNKLKHFQYSESIDKNLSDFHNKTCIITRFHVPSHKTTNVHIYHIKILMKDDLSANCLCYYLILEK